MRIVIGGLFHESNSFSPLPTDLAAFQAFQFKSGAEILAELPGTNTEIGGFLSRADELGFDIVPTVYAFAVPAGPVTRSAFEHICKPILEAAAAQATDGVFLSLHGALVVEDSPSGDAELLQRVRSAAPAAPIAATFDLHANWHDSAIEAADVLVGYDTFPHSDFAERGREAAGLLARMIRSGVRPAKAHCRLPLLTAPLMQSTDDEPMRLIMAAVHAAEDDPAIWCCSAVPGFAYADVGHLGFAVLAYGDGPAPARAVDAIARRVWDARGDFAPTLVSVETAVQQALAAARPGRPAILVESADNVGGGSPGDSTHVLSGLLKADAGPSVVVIWDPAAVERAMAAPEGRFIGAVGGRSGPLSGDPAELNGRVVFSGAVSYARTGSYMTGQRVDMGRVAVVRCGQVSVVLTSKRVMPFDADHLTCLGLRPEAQGILCVKSGSAWRAAFGDIAATAIHVDTPGVCASDVTRLPYAHLSRPMHPLSAYAAPDWLDEAN